MATVNIPSWYVSGVGYSYYGTLDVGIQRPGTSSSATIAFNNITMRNSASVPDSYEWDFWYRYRVNSGSWTSWKSVIIKSAGTSGYMAYKNATQSVSVGDGSGSIDVQVCLECAYTSGSAGESSQVSTSLSYGSKTTYTIAYNANGGSGAPSSQTKYYGTTLKLSSTKPTKSNATSTYTVTLNANGGSVSPSSITVTKTTSYSFSKWNTNSSGSGTSYAAGANYTANAAATLYAVWTSSVTTSSAALPSASRTGFTFQGWGTSASTTTVKYKAGDKPAASTTTLFAIWKANASTISSASNVTLGNAPSVKWTVYDTTYQYKLKFVCGSVSRTTGFLTASSTGTYTYSATNVLTKANFCPAIPSSKTGTCTVYLYTYTSAEASVGSASSKTFTITAPNDASVSTVATALVNDNTTVNGWGLAVQGYTKVRITTTAAASLGSSINQYAISNAASGTSTSNVFTTGVITSSGSKTFRVTITDSRGYTAYKDSGAITFYAYAKPAVTAFTVARKDSDKTIVRVRATATYSTVNNKNSLTLTLQKKERSSSTWANAGTLTSGSDSEFTGFETIKTYDFRVKATDSLNTIYSQTLSVQTTNVLLDFKAGTASSVGGLGIGKICENNDQLQVGFESHFEQTAYFKDCIFERDQYIDDATASSVTGGALNLRNSDIANVNGIYMSDKAASKAEGINWKNADSQNPQTWDSIWAADGDFYFAPASGSAKTVYHSGNAVGGASSILTSNLTASRALVSNSSGKVAVSAVTSTELGYLDGVTSAIQTQINDKANKGGWTASRALGVNSSGNIAVSSTTTTELGYVHGVTSAIQTQIDGKFDKGGHTESRALCTNSNGNVAVSSTTTTELGYVHGVTSAIQTQINGKLTASGFAFAAANVVGTDGSNVASGSAVNKGSFKLQKGYYVVTITTAFSSNQTGYRCIVLSSSSGGSQLNVASQVRYSPSGSGETRIQLTVHLHPTAETTYYIVLWQNSGATLTANTRLSYTGITLA